MAYNVNTDPFWMMRAGATPGEDYSQIEPDRAPAWANSIALPAPAPVSAPAPMVAPKSVAPISAAAVQKAITQAAFSKNSKTTDEASKGTTTSLNQMTPDQYTAAVNMIMNSPAYKSQVDELNKQQNAVLQYGALPTPTDMSPLASFIDNWAGTNTAPYMKPKESADERAKNTLNFLNKIQGDRASLVKEATAGVNSTKAGYDTILNTIATKQLLENGVKPVSSGANGAATDAYRMTKDFTKAIQPKVDAIEALNGVRSLLDSESSYAPGMVKLGLARGIGGLKGRIPVQEMNMAAGGDKAIGAVIDQAVSMASHGEMSPHNVSELKKALDVAEKGYRDGIDRIRNESAATAPATARGQTKESAGTLFSNIGNVPQYVAPQAKAPDPATKTMLEQIHSLIKGGK